MMQAHKTFLAFALLFLIAGCSTVPKQGAIERGEATAGQTKKSAKGGGYYLDDGPGDNPPPNLEATPDAEPKVEPLHKFANNPYSALGQEYVPSKELKPYKAQGLASWYGRRFHGKRTSSGEPYDMYAMTAAHPTLPIPSYARVTNLRNNKSVVVRVNDRGPFHSNRLIDLSYTAAYKLGITGKGSGMVEVEAINPLEYVAQANKPAEPPSAAPLKLADAAQAAEKPLPPSEDKGTYLQLAAFSQSGNAENFSARVRQQLGDVAEALQIIAKDGKYRVNLGPYQTESELMRVATLVKQSLNIAAVRVVR